MSRELRRIAVIRGWALCAMVALVAPGIAWADGLSLTGTITSASGEKMEGVTVSARAEGKTFATSVFTDADGEYFFPQMDAGRYKVWAQAVGYDAGRADLSLGASTARQDFVLKTTKDFTVQLTGDQWMAALPEDTEEHRRMKEVFRKTCAQCHTPAFVLQNRFDEQGWAKVITLMSRFSVFGGTVREDDAPNPVIRYYTKRLAAYLARMRGPGQSPMKFTLRPRPKGEATLAVITEYDVPLREGDADVSNGSDWSHGTPSHLNPEHHHAHDATQDLDGNIWLTDQALNAVRTIAKVDVKTGKVTPFKIAGPDGMALGTHANVRDQNGIIWSDVQSRPGTLLRTDPATGNNEVFTPPPGVGGVGAWVNMDGKGRVWANSGSGAVMFDPATKTFTEFKAVEPRSLAGSSSGYGVAGDRDGNGWWSQFSIDIVNKADPKTGKVEQIKLPPRETAAVRTFVGDDREVFELAGGDAFLWAAPWAQAPRRMAGDLNGDFIWVPLWHGQSVASINTSTHAVKYYPIPTLDAGPYEVKVDAQHMVWVDFMNSDTVGRLDPQTGKWVEYHLPTLGAETHSIGVLDTPRGTEVALAYFRAGKVARMQFRTPEELKALKAQARQAR